MPSKDTVLTKLIMRYEPDFSQDEAEYLASELAENFHIEYISLHEFELHFISLVSFILGVLVVVAFNLISRGV